MKQKLKNTRAVTYRRYGIPAVILEGKWLTEKYQLKIGDHVDIDYQSKEIRLKKNKTLPKRIQKTTNEITSTDEDTLARSGEISQR